MTTQEQSGLPLAPASASDGDAVCAPAIVRDRTQCRDCAQAARRKWHGFSAGCRGCCARAAGRSPQFAAARKAGVVDHQYRRLLDQFGLTHGEVKAAVAADKGNP